MDILWSICTLNNIDFAMHVAWKVLLDSGKLGGRGIHRNKDAYLRETCPQLDMEILVIFLE